MSNLRRFLKYFWLLLATCDFWSSAQRIIRESNTNQANGMDGIAGDSFSTYDRDNDEVSSYNCAEKHRAAWWYPDYYSYYYYSYCNYWYADGYYRSCADGSLNGLYGGGNGQTIFWDDYNYCGIKYVEMKVNQSIKKPYVTMKHNKMP
ncbi:Tenascin-R [Holothuria leucospilota]|uniref:Tenascin-R n=1 Tax=Holothuria leucospilota TaxID=206669 RepID=A0A9Q1H8T9_HOLLE|nr:Tenascin-R [Holothuria leucospilota]